MAVIHTLSAIGRFIRRTPPPPAELLEAYAHEVIPVMDRAEWLYEHWLEQSTLFTDSEKLGNVAAIHRWETATMGRSLERVIPPSVLADAHERVIDALELASRAAQLLSNGSRFHNANAVCEGQAMLAASRDRRLAALKSMRKYLAGVQPAPTPLVVEAPSETLAEAAALAASTDDARPSEQASADPVSDASAPEAFPIGATSADAEQPIVSPVAEGEAPWPEHLGADEIWTDPAEPVPAWLSAARAEAPTEAPAEVPVSPLAGQSVEPVRQLPAAGRTPPAAAEHTPPAAAEHTPPAAAEHTPPVPAEPTPPIAAEGSTPTPFAAERTPPPVAERTPPTSEAPIPPAPVANDDRRPDVLDGVKAPAPELAAPELSAPAPLPPETPAPSTEDGEPNGRAASPDPESASRSGWGSLFGRTPDQSGR